MTDLRILKAHGCSAEHWEKIFSKRERPHPTIRKDPTDKASSKTDKIDELVERIWNRVLGGRDWNFDNYSIIYAMDVIYDAPFRQVSPTLIYSVCEKHGNNTEEVKKALAGLGLDLNLVLVDTGADPKSGQPTKAVNVPAFFAVVVPLARAYMNIRRAKLVNERNRDPFIEYRPATRSKKNRVRCEVLTSRVQQTSIAYDYLGVLNQAVLQMLLYPSGCLVFTREEWDKCEQLRYEKEDKEKKYIVREGLRYHTPHPSRMYWDRAYPMRTFNTDTGCRFGGYWQVLRYGEVLDTPGFYNTEKVLVGNTGWFTTQSSFFNMVYGGCVVKTPNVACPDTVLEQDREQWMLDNQYYNTTMRDASVMLCEHREKLNPKQCGLGDYDHDIWCRFVVAGDGTIVYAAPLGYTPITVFKDHGDDKRNADASLILQLAPFQDQLSNLLTQFLFAVKQNLANLTMLEANMIGPEGVKLIKNLGEAYYRGHNFMTYDAKKLNVMQLDPRAAVISHRFPPLDTNGIVMAMKLVIDMAERVLQFSSQEIAQAASHEQTAKEVEKIAASTNNVLEFTGMAVDFGLNAMGHQLYEAVMNYGEDEFYAQVPSDHGLTEEQLTELGITQDDDDGDETPDKKLRVKAKKSAMTLDSFATVPPTTKRQTNWEAAQAMAGFVRDLMNNQMTAMAIGPKQAIDLSNQIAKLAGIQLDAELRDVTDETQKKMASDLLKQTVDAVLGVIRPEVKEGLEPVMSTIKDLSNKMNLLMQAAGINVTASPIPPVVQTGVGGPTDLAAPAVGPIVSTIDPNAAGALVA